MRGDGMSCLLETERIISQFYLYRKDASDKREAADAHAERGPRVYLPIDEPTTVEPKPTFMATYLAAATSRGNSVRITCHNRYIFTFGSYDMV